VAGFLSARRVLATLCVAAALWLGGAIGAAVLAVRQAQRGADLAIKAKAELSVKSVLANRPGPILADARRHLSRAHALLHSPLVTPLRWTPLIGRQVRAVSAQAAAGAKLAAVGRTAVTGAKTVLESPPTEAAGRVELVKKLGALATTASSQLEGLDLGPDSALVGPVRHRRVSVARELAGDRKRLTDAAATAAAVADLLTGPRRYLVIAANNAEMRNGSGMFLSAGVLETVDGELNLGPMRPTAELAPADGVPIGGDLEELWGWTHPTHEWRNLAMSARFDVTAALAARMWKATTGVDVDGVVAVDVGALQALLAGAGPVTIGDRVLTSETVVPFLLSEQYFGITDTGKDDPAQVARREQLSAIAHAAIDGLRRPDVNLSALGESLIGAAEGRHVLAWSARPEEQRAWKAAGIDGSLSSKTLLVALLNRAGNKLDSFVGVTSRITERSKGEVRLTVKIENKAPTGMPAYVDGPAPGSIAKAPGEYAGLLAITLPYATTDIRVADTVPIGVGGPDGPTRVLALSVSLPRGATASYTVDFRLPEKSTIRVDGSARLPPGEWRHGKDKWNDGHRLTVHLGKK
jgi:hypothetical protein